MGVSIVFVVNIVNLHLTTTDFFIIVFIATLWSIGTAAVPAAGLVTPSAVLMMLFGLPLEIVALIAGVDALIGMRGTTSNVIGDIGTALVNQSERKQIASYSVLRQQLFDLLISAILPDDNHRLGNIALSFNVVRYEVQKLSDVLSSLRL
ncbi:cation:dicarboxylate symporter family transporter [Domibacillus aminovorans]|uniref:Cation:dicarboxylase symporter family transporter n=1 Tax=Domibacillus aminovorans TaxID=29332 RepID=A0A177L259_9BACI|nr:cation:dicarboxylase symporter family transporter [Domibacillus aminovorans]OAH59750.1 hypothetical protein AWH49_03280 [Domibacillus aminovorans]